MRVRNAPTKTVWLPSPVAEKWEWQLEGRCRGTDSSAFFHPPDERGHAHANREMVAKQICSSCGVVDQCRRYALAAREPFGVWGGLSESERAKIYRQAGDVSHSSAGR
ncbi:WhiB family transcriptional regulator [Rhodococcus sp. NPDC057297]|uniref:WhiB family transcriptional regulator n=1 Tax=Rhodococcus sp. NPDC057297 TaxID=3346090 RepID=UPI0036356A74